MWLLITFTFFWWYKIWCSIQVLSISCCLFSACRQQERRVNGDHHGREGHLDLHTGVLLLHCHHILHPVHATYSIWQWQRHVRIQMCFLVIINILFFPVTLNLDTEVATTFRQKESWLTSMTGSSQEKVSYLWSCLWCLPRLPLRLSKISVDAAMNTVIVTHFLSRKLLVPPSSSSSSPLMM